MNPNLQHSVEQVLYRMAELCVAFKSHGVVGFDLAGSVVNNPAKLHRQAFQVVIGNNNNCTARKHHVTARNNTNKRIENTGNN